MTIKRSKPNPTTADPLEAAQAKLRQREDEYSHAVATLAQLRERLAEGDETASAHTAAAVVKIEDCELLLSAARTALASAEAADSRARAHAEPVVAEALASLLTTHAQAFGIYGYPLARLDELPDEPQSPALYVTPHRAASLDIVNGTVNGTAVLHFVADASHVEQFRKLLERIRDVAASERVATDISYGSIPSRDLGEGVTVWSRLVMIKGLQPELPTVVARPEPFRYAALGSMLKAEVSASAGAYQQDGIRTAGDTGARSSHVHVVVEDHGMVGVVTDDDGVTRRTLRYTLSVSSRALDTDRLQANTLGAIARTNGCFVSGVGRVESVSTSSIKPLPNGREVAVTVVTKARSV